MSTGADCRFYEKTKGQWFYDLQQYPYGENEDYKTYGPFRTFAAAEKHLSDNHANPGGYTVSALPGCPHDMLVTAHQPDTAYCNRCGGTVTTLTYKHWREVIDKVSDKPQSTWDAKHPSQYYPADFESRLKTIYETRCSPEQAKWEIKAAYDREQLKCSK